MICDHLEDSRNLKSIKLRGNKIDDEGVKILCKALFALNITNLDLSDNCITWEGVDYLLTLSSTNKHIKNIRLRCNKLDKRNFRKMEREFKKQSVNAEF